MRFVVVGATGWVGQKHAEYLTEMKRNVVGLVDPADGCKALAQRMGTRSFVSLNNIDWSEFDAAIVALPPKLQPDLVASLLKAGKHVLCEKPMAGSLPGAERLLKLSRMTSAKLMPGYQLRFPSLVSSIS